MQSQPDFTELTGLLTLLCDGDFGQSEQDRLEQILLDDPEAQRYYARFLALDEELAWSVAAPSHTSLPVSIPISSPSDIDAQPSPPHAPFFVTSSIHDTVGYFSSGWPVAYLVAIVIFGLGLLIGTLTHVSQPTQVAQQFDPLPSPPHSSSPFVGRITGMVDCQWADDATAAFNGAYVPSGRKYALSSGLMEITYDTGAKVILQGPVTYEVESAASGYLSVGKLTAKVEKRGEGEEIDREGSQNTPYSVLRTSHSALFAVRTPTAVVTDLGTEFGVEVGDRGNTTSHVFQGSVEVQMVVADRGAERVARVLYKNQSARVEKSSDAQDSGNRITVFIAPVTPTSFVREIPKHSSIKTLDLVDVVAGGDGFSGRRNRGIDTTSGKPTVALPPLDDAYFIRNGDGHYHQVDAMPFVDGVFIPDGRAGRVQIDSTGRTFDGFPPTTNTTSGYLWAGGEIPSPHADRGFRILPATLDGVDYSSPGHGVLSLQSNKGITFDLQAIRHANPNWKPVRFLATTGNTETYSGTEEGGVCADVWVLADSRVRFRRNINRSHGAFSVVIPINEEDRFLTLAATDADDGIGFDWIMFGDPRLELRMIGTNKQGGTQKQHIPGNQ